MKYGLVSLLFFVHCSLSFAQQTVINIDFTDSMFSKLSQEEKDILNEYAKIYPKIKYFYENARFNTKVKIYSFSDKDNIPLPQGSLPSLKREEDIEVRYNQLHADKKFIRVDKLISFIDSDNKDVQDKNKERYISKYIMVFTPTVNIELEKKNKKNPYYSIVTRRKTNNGAILIPMAIMLFDTAPFAETGTTLERMFFRKPPFLHNKDKYVIDYVKPFADNGEQCIEIKSSIMGTDNFWIFKLSKDHFWSVKEIYEHTENAWHKSHCVYDGFHEKIPLLKFYQIDYGRYDLDVEKTEQLTSQVQYEVTQIIPGAVDLSEFDVAQFLPPETRIGEVTTTQFSWFRIICILLGILLFIVGGWLKMRKV